MWRIGGRSSSLRLLNVLPGERRAARIACCRSGVVFVSFGTPDGVRTPPSGHERLQLRCVRHSHGRQEPAPRDGVHALELQTLAVYGYILHCNKPPGRHHGQ